LLFTAALYVATRTVLYKTATEDCNPAIESNVGQST
jgi:hypothetical protein